MTQAMTTSIRLAPELLERLAHVCHVLHRGKNWVIAKALEEYLTKTHRDALVLEAKRQSLLATKADREDDTIWYENMDTSGWK